LSAADDGHLKRHQRQHRTLQMRPVNIDCRFILLVALVAFTLARRHGGDRAKKSAVLQSPLIRITSKIEQNAQTIFNFSHSLVRQHTPPRNKSVF